MSEPATPPPEKTRKTPSKRRRVALDAPFRSTLELGRLVRANFGQADCWARIADFTWQDRFFRVFSRSMVWLLVLLSPSYNRATQGGVDPTPIAPLSREALDNMFWMTLRLTRWVCLFGTGVAAYVAGTLTGKEAGRFYYLQDGFDLFLYAFVCPAYVGGCACILRIALSQWTDLRRFADDKRVGAFVWAKHRNRSKLFCLILVMLCLASTCLYVHDALHLPRKFVYFSQPFFGGSELKFDARTYWFARGEPGHQFLNLAGWYYAVENFLLLLATMIGVPSYFSLAYEALRVARAQSSETVREDVAAVKARMDSFILAYHYARIVAAAYIVNYAVWGHSPLGGTKANMMIALVALVVLTGQFLAFPINYVEGKWNRLLGEVRLDRTRKIEEEIHERSHHPGQTLPGLMEQQRTMLEALTAELAPLQLVPLKEQQFHKVMQWCFWGVLSTLSVTTGINLVLDWTSRAAK